MLNVSQQDIYISCHDCWHLHEQYSHNIRKGNDWYKITSLIPPPPPLHVHFYTTDILRFLYFVPFRWVSLHSYLHTWTTFPFLFLFLLSKIQNLWSKFLKPALHVAQILYELTCNLMSSARTDREAQLLN